MIVCKECGFKNSDADSFCGACGDFLEWTGEKVAAPAEAEDVEEAPRKRSLYERIQKVMYADVGEAKPVESSTPGGPGGPGGPRPPGAGGPPGAAGPPGAGGPPRPPGAGGPPQPPGAGGPPRPPGVGGPPRPPGAGGPPRPPGVGDPPQPPGAGGPPRPPGVGGPPRPPGAGAPPQPPGAGAPPRPPGVGAPPQPPGVGGPPQPPGVVSADSAPTSTSGPGSSEARQIAAALVARPPTPAGPGGGPALPTRTQPPAAPVSSEAAGTIEQPQAVQPSAIQPQAPQRRKPPKVQPGKPTRTPQKGDLICGECGEANSPGRKFCSRCGTSLAAAVAVRIPWWKKLLPRRRPKSAMAGERPWSAASGGKKRPKRKGLSRFWVPVRRVGGILLLVAGILWGVYSPFRNWVNDRWTTAKDKVESVIHPQFDPVTAGPGTTSNETAPLDPDHPAAMATDGFKNTYWLSAPPGAGSRPELDVALTEQVDLVRIIVHNGAADDFQGHHRPKTLLFIFDTGASDEVELNNSPEPQTITIKNGKDVQRFKIAVTSVYESIDGTDMALNEIEFFKKD